MSRKRREEIVEEIVKDIKITIKEGSFKINGRTYVPLHATSYPQKILKRLQIKGFLARRGTLNKVLLKNGLTYQHYIKLRGRINLYHPLITCFEILKDII